MKKMVRTFSRTILDRLYPLFYVCAHTLTFTQCVLLYEALIFRITIFMDILYN